MTNSTEATVTGAYHFPADLQKATIAWARSADREGTQRGKLADMFFALGVPSTVYKAVKEGQPDTVHTLANGDKVKHSDLRLALREAIELSYTDAERTLLATAKPKSEAKRKAKRALQQRWTPRARSLCQSLAKREKARDDAEELAALQAAEDKAAKAEGREPEQVELPKAVKSDAVRINDRVAEIIKIAEKSEEPAFDATKVKKLASEIAALVLPHVG